MFVIYLREIGYSLGGYIPGHDTKQNLKNLVNIICCNREDSHEKITSFQTFNDFSIEKNENFFKFISCDGKSFWLDKFLFEEDFLLNKIPKENKEYHFTLFNADTIQLALDIYFSSHKVFMNKYFKRYISQIDVLSNLLSFVDFMLWKSLHFMIDQILGNYLVLTQRSRMYGNSIHRDNVHENLDIDLVNSTFSTFLKLLDKYELSSQNTLDIKYFIIHPFYYLFLLDKYNYHSTLTIVYKRMIEHDKEILFHIIKNNFSIIDMIPYRIFSFFFSSLDMGSNVQVSQNFLIFLIESLWKSS